jgi:exonuclease III
MMPSTGGSLLVLLWNANGLNPHRNELELLLRERRIDIALLTETHFTNRSHFHIPGYVTHVTNHPDNTAHGGTAILIRQQLIHCPIPSIPTDSLQYTAISVKAFPFPLSLSAVYCPPNKHPPTNKSTPCLIPSVLALSQVETITRNIPSGEVD